MDKEILDVLEIEKIKKQAEQVNKNLTKKEFDEKVGKLSLMNARMIQGVFSENKNNHLVLGIVNEIRKIHGLGPATAITNTVVENLSPVRSIFERNMTADLIGTGNKINLAVEVQNQSQEDYAIRGTVSSSNQMKTNFEPGKGFGEAPDVFGINILGFNLQELINDKNFLSIVTRVNKGTGEYFLENKYSDYYICLPKMAKDRKNVQNEYRELWDICMAFKSEVKKYDEVMNMVQSPVAKELISQARTITTNPRVVSEAMSIEEEQILFERYIESRERVKASQVEINIALNYLNNAKKNNLNYGVDELMNNLGLEKDVAERATKLHKKELNKEVENDLIKLN